MYAVVKTGGKQYRVIEGDTLRVENLRVIRALQSNSRTFWP